MEPMLHDYEQNYKETSALHTGDAGHEAGRELRNGKT